MRQITTATDRLLRTGAARRRQRKAFMDRAVHDRQPAMQVIKPVVGHIQAALGDTVIADLQRVERMDGAVGLDDEIAHEWVAEVISSGRSTQKLLDQIPEW